MKKLLEQYVRLVLESDDGWGEDEQVKDLDVRPPRVDSLASVVDRNDIYITGFEPDSTDDEAIEAKEHLLTAFHDGKIEPHPRADYYDYDQYVGVLFANDAQGELVATAEERYEGDTSYWKPWKDIRKNEARLFESDDDDWGEDEAPSAALKAPRDLETRAWGTVAAEDIMVDGYTHEDDERLANYEDEDEDLGDEEDDDFDNDGAGGYHNEMERRDAFGRIHERDALLEKFADGTIHQWPGADYYEYNSWDHELQAYSFKEGSDDEPVARMNVARLTEWEPL